MAFPRCVAAALLPLSLAFSSALAQLPPLPLAARLDLLELRMSEAVKAEKYPEFLTLLADFRKDGGRVGPELAYYEAVAHEKAGRPAQALEAASAFVAQAGREHPLYAQALLLYSRVEPGARQAQQVRSGLEPLLQALQQGSRRVHLQADAANVDLAAAVASSRRDRGLLPLADGGWIVFGARSLVPGTRGTAAAWQRHGANGQAQLPQGIDLQGHGVAELQPGTPGSPKTFGIGVLPTVGPGTVVAFAPRSTAAAAGLRIGDRITHVDGRELSAEDGLFRKRDHFYDVLRAAEGAVRLGVQRAGSSGLLEITLQPSAEPETQEPSIRFGRVLVERARWNTGAPAGGTAPPFSEIVALAGDPAEGGQVCGNVRFGASPSSPAFGFWGTPAAAPGTAFLWGMPSDHAAAMDGKRAYVPWHDSALFDCVQLPDGALLTVGAATRRSGTEAQGSGVEADRSSRVFRVFEPDGRLRATLSLQAAKAVVDASAFGRRTRFQPAAEGTGRHWAWGDWVLDAGAGGLRQADPAQGPPLVAVRTPADDTWHQLVVAGRALPLVGKASASDLVLHQVERLADGTVLALLGLRMAQAVHAELLPDGQALGAEMLNKDDPLGLVVALDAARGAVLWAVAPRHGLAPQARELERSAQARSRPAGEHYIAGSILRALGSDGLAWRAMRVLGDGSVLVQTGAGQGIHLRPGPVVEPASVAPEQASVAPAS